MRIFLVILLCLSSLRMQAQQDSVKKVTTTAALLYNSNISYYGQATTTRYPYILANVTLRFPIGLAISAGGYQLLNDPSNPSETDLGIGYEHQFNEAWNAGLTYTRSFYPANSPLLAASNENNLSLSFAYDGPHFKSTLSTDYAFGTQQDVFISLTTGKAIDLGAFLSPKNLLALEPAIELVAGTNQFYETFILEKEKRNKGKGQGAQIPVTSTIMKNSFNLLSYNFKLPITLSRANYMVEANYQFSILGKKVDENLRSQYSVFGFALYYQF